MVSASTTATSCAQLLRQCEALKGTIIGKSNEATSLLSDEFISRQRLEGTYKSLLLSDIQFALDNKVELELWNYAFKGHIDNLRQRMKNKNEKNELQAKLSLFIDSSSGFYFQLLQEFCDRYELDLPYHTKPSQLGILSGSKKLYHGTKPKMNSCLYICQDCLVHLGDLARYRNDSQQANSFYELASKILPGNGQPYNQLAILATARSNSLLAVFYYLKSISVPNPFPAASSNLLKTFGQVCSKPNYSILAKSTGITVNEFCDLFLQLIGCIHLQQDAGKLAVLKEKVLQDFKEVVYELSAAHTVFIAGICVFVMSKKRPSGDEESPHQLIISLSIGILNTLVLCCMENHQQLSGVKLLTDWILCNNNALQHLQQSPEIFGDLVKFGNELQAAYPEREKSSIPLLEDWLLHGLINLRKAHKRYDFKVQPSQLNSEEPDVVRATRVLQFLEWLVQQAQVSQFMTKDETSGRFVCLQPTPPSHENNEFDSAVKDLLQAIPNMQRRSNSESRSKSPFSDNNSRSLFRTESEENEMREMNNTGPSYSLFQTMLNNANYSSASSNPGKDSVVVGSPLMPIGGGFFPNSSANSTPPHYKHPDQLQLNAFSSPTSAVQSPMSPSSGTTPRVPPPGFIQRPLRPSFVGQPVNPSFGVIGQVKPPHGIHGQPPGMHGPRDQWVPASGPPVGPSNQSIWSSNFAMGQGALSPLEQLLQEQKRHQRPK